MPNDHQRCGPRISLREAPTSMGNAARRCRHSPSLSETTGCRKCRTVHACRSIPRCRRICFTSQKSVLKFGHSRQSQLRVSPFNCACHRSAAVFVHDIPFGHLTMDFSATFSSDQIAIMGCFAALAVCGLMAMVSFHIGSAGKSSQTSRARSESLTFPRPSQTQSRDREAA